jgi:hypothetical protein
MNFGISNPCTKFHGISNPVELLYHHLLAALKMTLRAFFLPVQAARTAWKSRNFIDF